jgi:predicted O-methyltransferase YrrM
MNKDKANSVLRSPDTLKCLFTDPLLSGFSGKKIIALLQNLSACLDPHNEIYLEIGVFQGMSLMSVSKVFEGRTFGIDNFSQFDPEKKNYTLIREHCRRLGIENATLINCDFEEALKTLKDHTGDAKTGLLFIDGPHDYRSQLLSLLLSVQYLSENAVIVVDDSNYRHVRQANDDFLSAFPSYSLAFERYTKAHPGNLPPEERENAREGWWNGINVLVSNSLIGQTSAKISTFQKRDLYYNDHHVHSSRYADCAPEAMAVTHVLRPLRPLKLVDRLINLYKKIKRSDPLFHGKFRHLNTYTDDLA